MKTFLLLIVLWPSLLVGQTAKFYMDSLDTRNLSGNRQKMDDHFIDMEWKIRGNSIHYQNKVVELTIAPDKIDTLFYRHHKQAKWDTIICLIREPGEYKFIYNECCGGFNIADKNGKLIQASINFQLHSNVKHKQFLGTLGETGILVNYNSTDTLKPGCRSAMSPNIYPLTFQEIKIAKDMINAKEGTCLYEKGKEELNYEFGYKTISTKLNCLFMPLSKNPIWVMYDPIENKISIKQK
ncbi:MAG: hypothetical protein JWM14_3348 [Chitinophagaceae bacterium]|nr:hypothetical protein [Chitinophagaceae bacterium]